MDVDKALATQLANIEKRTGKTLAELQAIVQASGLTKHGECVNMLKTSLGMGHGDANTVVHTVKQLAVAGTASSARAPSTDRAESVPSDVLDALYSGAKTALRPIHDALLVRMHTLGAFESSPKKSYVSYRRSKQFCMIGPATNSRVEVGLNVRGLQAQDRLEELPAGQMCQYKVRVTDVSQVDDELIAWIALAYEGA
ncbi:MAG TPA: DUF4287 domain-containing protein [Gemmatimonas aurantiaca]|uniref:DUF5655 domain-containing protein n=2 Tax=Gemmatimonas aurantiaca TaxID=173480 RepID=C1A706_GEMAT|nr:DUF4287 domain-containing protein [Gemmatimonas aurantiaca]BAH38016.1 hypothetical protein GAU_0974 [Gemmatimonas aurantiaca T-27]HCT56790.1 DUF4287 domain-containing protein [Gemmatimonas aurantiaca]